MPGDAVFVTAALAEIYLGQEMLDEAKRMIDTLLARDPHDKRAIDLLSRLEVLREKGQPIPSGQQAQGRDRIALEEGADALFLDWEITEAGSELARRTVRFSGSCVVRLFTAAPGPRGVRTGSREIEVEVGAHRLELHGLPCPAVHVAAVGYLARTGAFVPLAGSGTLIVNR